MPRRPPLAALAALAATALVAGSCSQDPVVPKVGEQPIALAVALSSQTMRLGTPDTIRVTATNTLNERVVLTFATSCQITVTIRNASGDAVIPPNGRHGCVPVTSNLSISALASVTFTFVWDGRTEFLPTSSTVRVPPGSYFVSAAIDATNYSTIAPAIRVEVTP